MQRTLTDAATEQDLADPKRRADEDFEQRLQILFRRCDKDGDQRLNPIESLFMWQIIQGYFEGGSDLSFKRMRYDTNKDSWLDGNEFKTVAEELRKARK